MSLDKLVGLSMLLIANLIFIYYTVWTFVLPFINEESFIQLLFPPRDFAIKIPVLLLILGTSLVGLFIGSVLVKAQKKKSKKN
ncbi:hypothetical protein CANARDRAFT_26789 [[Candida] arabinofermentans NRRL YB-2248]|uniref:Dolichol phosphate-mannose biosynthesis regulatory protein n=1 Tax=[Candida] arabinofermentans NRRL YB-2248 TaxID=983967 RepID=A0A1E4T6K7_9ASCO|nr:hypothetical protein CANARDRAFT_26789 [[Candida] arabinofermentans NRRL YB-2248]